jgi:hypothetical protein
MMMMMMGLRGDGGGLRLSKWLIFFAPCSILLLISYNVHIKVRSQAGLVSCLALGAAWLSPTVAST